MSNEDVITPQEDMSSQKTYKVAISSMRFEGKPSSVNWAAFNDGFRNMELDSMRFIDAIYKGYCFCPWMRGRRSKENFQLAQHIAIDMDTEDHRSSLDYLIEHPLVAVHGGIVYRTPSSTPDKPRSRVVFLLDSPILKSDGYTMIAHVMTQMFDGDVKCAESSRFFFGNGKLYRDGDTSGIRFTEHFDFTIDDLKRYYNQWLVNTRANHVVPERPAWSSSTGNFDPSKFIEANLKNATSGNRNHLGYWLAKIMQEEGLTIFEAEPHMLEYQRAVTTMHDPYTEREALATLRSAYR